jgi:hypothetical protein
MKQRYISVCNIRDLSVQYNEPRSQEPRVYPAWSMALTTELVLYSGGNNVLRGLQIVEYPMGCHCQCSGSWTRAQFRYGDLPPYIADHKSQLTL